MRSLSANALTKIATQYGSEPIFVVGVQWSDGISYYADRNIDSIKGRILSVSVMDNVITVSNNNDSQEINVILDDSDGIIKTIMDTNDVHKKDVWVYQWFEGLNFDDKFLLFRGKINTPIIWSEGARTISFSIVSQLEDKEIGFSPEEGQFPFIPSDLIGTPWPMIYGTAVDVPCAQITKAITGTTLEGVGIVSGESSHNNVSLGTNPPDLAMLSWQMSHVSFCASAWVTDDPVQYAKFNDQYNDLADQAALSAASYLQTQRDAQTRREATITNAVTLGEGTSSLQILGGEDFPRGPLTLKIGSGLFNGSFTDDIFNISSRVHTANDEAIVASATNDYTPLEFKPNQKFNFVSKVPDGSGGLVDYQTEGEIIYSDESISRPNARQRARHYWADAGTHVSIASDEPITYIVSIIPGTVLRVKAFKDFDGVKRLIDLPTNLYSVSNVTYGSIDTVQVVTTTLLSTILDQEWDDELYVTFESDVGPNIVDILKDLIDTYTNFTYNNTTFNAVRTKLTNFPANFAYLQRKNIVDVLNEIAFQARCSLRLVNNIFYLNYLAEEPTTIDTIEESDIENQSIEVSMTPTEDIVTKYTANWRISLAQKDPNRIILRHNVSKYGIQEEDYDFYIYNQPDIILKVATFWLIRKSNTWKQINFNTFLSKLNLETFDAILLDFDTDYVSTDPVKAIIQSADFNSEDQTISISCWLPIKSGTMTSYNFFWPADVDATYIFPTEDEVDLGLDGGGGVGMNATGELPIGNTEGIDTGSGIFIGGPNIVFGPQADRGDIHPSDQGFTPQSLNIPVVTGELTVTANPNPYLDLNYAAQPNDPKLPPLPSDPNWIVLEDTKIKTREYPTVTGYLSNFLILNTETFAIKTSVSFTDDTNIEPFDFEFDTEGEKWGAGTAFLQD